MKRWKLKASLFFVNIASIYYLNFMQEKLYEEILPILESAGDIALQYFRSWVKVHSKDNQTTVTIADIKVSDCLIEELPKLVQWDVYSEEKQIIPSSDYLWLIDPIDWTKQFIAWEETRTIMIGLAHKTEWALFWVIYYPYSWSFLLGSKQWPIIFSTNGKVFTLTWEAGKDEALYKATSISKPEVVALIEWRKKEWINISTLWPEWHMYTTLVTEGYKHFAIRRCKGYEMWALAWILASSPRQILADGEPFNVYNHPGKLDKIITISQ